MTCVILTSCCELKRHRWSQSSLRHLRVGRTIIILTNTCAHKSKFTCIHSIRGRGIIGGQYGAWHHWWSIWGVASLVVNMGRGIIGGQYGAWCHWWSIWGVGSLVASLPQPPPGHLV